MTTKSPVYPNFTLEPETPLCPHRKIPSHIQVVYCQEKPIRLEDKTYLKKIAENFSNSPQSFYKNKKDLEASIFALDSNQDQSSFPGKERASLNSALNLKQKFRQNYRKSKQFWFKTKALEVEKSIMWLKKPSKPINISDVEINQKLQRNKAKNVKSSLARAKAFLEKSRESSKYEYENQKPQDIINSQLQKIDFNEKLKSFSFKKASPHEKEQENYKENSSKACSKRNSLKAIKSKSYNDIKSLLASKSSLVASNIKENNSQIKFSPETKSSLSKTTDIKENYPKSSKSFLAENEISTNLENLESLKSSQEFKSSNSLKKTSNRIKRNFKKSKIPKSSLENKSSQDSKSCQEKSSTKDSEKRSLNSFMGSKSSKNKSFGSSKSFLGQKNTKQKSKDLDFDENVEPSINKNQSLEAFKSSFQNTKTKSSGDSKSFCLDKKTSIKSEDCETKENTKSSEEQKLKSFNNSKSFQSSKLSLNDKRIEAGANILSNKRENSKSSLALNKSFQKSKSLEDLKSFHALNSSISHKDINDNTEIDTNKEDNTKSSLAKNESFVKCRSLEALKSLNYSKSSIFEQIHEKEPEIKTNNEEKAKSSAAQCESLQDCETSETLKSIQSSKYSFSVKEIVIESKIFENKPESFSHGNKSLQEKAFQGPKNPFSNNITPIETKFYANKPEINKSFLAELKSSEEFKDLDTFKSFQEIRNVILESKNEDNLKEKMKSSKATESFSYKTKSFLKQKDHKQTNAKPKVMPMEKEINDRDKDSLDKDLLELKSFSEAKLHLKEILKTNKLEMEEKKEEENGKKPELKNKSLGTKVKAPKKSLAGKKSSNTKKYSRDSEKPLFKTLDQQKSFKEKEQKKAFKSPDNLRTTPSVLTHFLRNILKTKALKSSNNDPKKNENKKAFSNSKETKSKAKKLDYKSHESFQEKAPIKEKKKLSFVEPILKNYPETMRPKIYPQEVYDKLHGRQDHKAHVKAPQIIKRNPKFCMTNDFIIRDLKALNPTKALVKESLGNKLKSSKVQPTSSCYSKTLEALMQLGKPKTLNNSPLEFAKDPMKVLENLSFQVMKSKRKK